MAKWMKIKISGEWVPFNAVTYAANTAMFEKIEKTPLYCKKNDSGKLFAFSPHLASRPDMTVLYEIPEELKKTDTGQKKDEDDGTGSSENSGDGGNEGDDSLIIPDDAVLEGMPFAELKSLLKGHYSGTPTKDTLLVLAKELRDQMK